VRWIGDALHDLRYGARLLRRSPALTAAIVLSLALGIGANTAIFTVIDVLMLRALPVQDPERLILVTTPSYNLSHGLSEKFRDGAPGVAALSSIIHTDRYNVTIGASGGVVEIVDSGPVRLALVSGNYFSTLGVRAAIGRTLDEDDDRLSGGRQVAIISDAYWDRRFARAPGVLGRTLTVSGKAYDIVGVAPRGFTGEWVGLPTDVWMPIVMQPQVMVEIPLGLQNAGATVIGRLKADVTIPQAAAALDAVFRREVRQESGSERWRVEVVPAARGYSPQRQSFGQSLTILMAAVGLVLLIACANIANLLLARSAARQREMALRLAVGAGRGRLVRQLLMETMILVLIGGAVGLVFAQWVTATLVAFVGSGPVTRAGTAALMDLDVHPDGRILAFTAALCVLTGVLCGLAPAFRGSKLALAPALTGRGTNAGGLGGPFSIGKLLVISQVALSLVLLIGAALFGRTLRNLANQDLGFDREHVLLVWTLPGQADGRGPGAADAWQRVLDRLSALPGVASASASNQGVLNGVETGGSGVTLRIEGEGPVTGGPSGWRSFVAPGFFKTMGIPLVAGRDFLERDTALAPRVVIISETVARYYFGRRNPVGLRVGFPEDTGTPTEIIGVVKDFTGGTPRETSHRPGLTYFSYRDREAARRLRTMTIAVRTSGDPLAIVNRIRQELRDVDLQLPILRIDTVEQQLNDVLVQERLIAALSGFFGALALLLACLGLYGVISYAVTRRTAEIGVRLALGATRGQVLRAILQESLLLVLAGVAIGVPVTLVLTRLIAARLFGVGAADPFTIAGSILLMTAIATLASLVPARRASRVDPMIALRCD
jgi:predicted permease